LTPGRPERYDVVIPIYVYILGGSVPQLTIYVPKEVADALDKYKARLNVSQICAQALRQEVGKMEIQTTEGGEFELLLERLRREREQSAAHAPELERARERAAKWVARAHFDQLRYYGELESDGDPDAFYETEFRFPDDGEEDAAQDYRDNRQERHLHFSWEAYCRAWHEYVQDFWGRIKDRL
jgi:hypothetical protein